MRSVMTSMMKRKPVIAIAGVTGAVGKELLDLIAERKFPYSDIIPLASKRSAGKTFSFQNKDYTIQELTENSFANVDIAFFSAGGSVSKKFAPIAGKTCVVIDNSSAFRMTEGVPLVVPEINPHHIKWIDSLDSKIIANPNCSTILMNMAVFPLHQVNPVERIVVSTYQAASGAGLEAMNELEKQAKEYVEGQDLSQDIFGRQYIFNLFSHNSAIDEKTGYNEEEIKMVKETAKIFDDPSIKITATCIRVPVLRAHCESINLSFKNSMTEEKVKEVLGSAPGVQIMDDRKANAHPEPILTSGKDDIYVGRIRQDLSQEDNKGIEMFISGDQIRKGAALNAIQIGELLLPRFC